MRKKFLEPEMDIIKFGKEDIITTSPLDGNEQGNNGDGELGGDF